LKQAGFHTELIRANVQRLKKLVRALSWNAARSEWSHYVTECSYKEEDLAQKISFVQNAVSHKKWNLVFDLGCNTGRFSRIAAANAAYTVAIDSDHLAVEKFYRELKSENNTSILPLVMNLADPSPSLGWRGRERKALIDRDKPDLVIALAFIHHMVIRSNIPMQELLDWLADWTEFLVIEFPTKSDNMVQVLLRNKEDQYHDYELPYFEKCLFERFEMLQRAELMSGNRILYFVRTRRHRDTEQN
jgi:SAM-dependent methyltransferase